MRIAVVSGIHDHVWNLALGLEAVRDAEALVCCGDLCSPFIVHLRFSRAPDRRRLNAAGHRPGFELLAGGRSGRG